MHLPAPSSFSHQDTLSAADPSWSYQGQPPSILSRQDILPAADPSWTYQGQPPSILSRQDTLPFEDPSWPYQGQPAPSSLSCQDTLPSEDPSWSYSWVQGQPAPIPPRNEPLLYIPNNVVDHELALKKLQPRIPPTTFESNLNGMRIDGTTASDSGKIPSFPEVRIIDGPLSFLPKPCSQLDDTLLLSGMTLLTIHGTIYFIY
jgi:hypothetical protein